MNASPMESKRILVTGGAGVIGRELLRMLIMRGATILSVDRRALPDGDWQRVSHIEKDLADGSLDEVREFQPQIVFHLAAAFERSSESPEFWSVNWRDNVLLSHRVVQLAAELSSTETFVFASSYLAYWPTPYLSETLRPDAVCLKEEDPIGPRNLCGAAKYYTERELSFVKAVLDRSFRTIHARIFRVFGCGSQDVISRWTRAALRGKGIEVYNKDNRFDFIFARDVAEGLARLSETPNAEGPVNLGSGVARSIRELIAALTSSCPLPLKISDAGVREPFEASCADMVRFKQLTGWAPAIDLRNGIRMVAEFEEGRERRGRAPDESRT